jgi:hypothetical protein
MMTRDILLKNLNGLIGIVMENAKFVLVDFLNVMNVRRKIMTITKKPLWWAYLDDSGKIHVKRYTTDRAIQNCEQMPFCKGIFDPFYADNLHKAQLKIAAFLDEQRYFEKKENK